MKKGKNPNRREMTALGNRRRQQPPECNGRGCLTPGSELGLMGEGVGTWTDKDKTWGNGQGKDVALRWNNC